MSENEMPNDNGGATNGNGGPATGNGGGAVGTLTN